MELQEIKELMLISIQVIGIFIAIIGGLVASKLLSMKAEKDEVSEKIKILDMKIKHNEKILNDNIQNCYRKYKEYEYDIIIDALLGISDDYNPFEYYHPYINDDVRKEFINQVCDIVEKIKSNEKYSNMNSTEIAEDMGYSKRQLEYKIIDYYIENKD